MYSWNFIKCQQLQPKLEASGQRENEAEVTVYNFCK